MKIIIACNDRAITSIIRANLRTLGVDSAVSEIPLAEVATAITTSDSHSPPIVFVGSQQFTPEELLELEQLHRPSAQCATIVAVGPTSRPETVIRVMRNGAVDYLDINGPLERDLRALFDRLKSAPRDEARAGRLFTVLSPSGGTGASLLATNLAAALAQLEPPCCLLDLQMHGGDLATMLKTTPRHNLLSLASKAQQFDRAMFDQSLVKHDCGIHLLASPEPFSDYRQISAQVIQRVVQCARSSCRNVVVDLEDAEHPEQVQTLARSDQIVIPLRLDFVSLCRAKKCIDHLVQSKVAREHIILVANRTGQPKELPRSRVAEVLGLPIQHWIPDTPAMVTASLNIGIPLVIEYPRAAASIRIVQLAESLIGIERVEAVHESNAVKKVCSRAAGLLAQIWPL